MKYNYGLIIINISGSDSFLQSYYQYGILDGFFLTIQTLHFD